MGVVAGIKVEDGDAKGITDGGRSAAGAQKPLRVV